MIKAVILDVDGVLVDSEPLHVEAWKRFCKKKGFHLSDEQLQNAVGLYDGEAVRFWFGRDLSGKEVDKIVREKFDEYYALLSEKFPTFPGVADCVKALAGEFRLAIASSEWRASIGLVTRRLGIKEYIEAACGKEDVTHHKPHPEIYLKLSKIMNVPAEEIAAVEDSPAGIRSAKAASCKCIGITNSFSEDTLKNTGADAVIGSLENPGEIIRIIKSL